MALAFGTMTSTAWLLTSIGVTTAMAVEGFGFFLRLRGEGQLHNRMALGDRYCPLDLAVSFKPQPALDEIAEPDPVRMESVIVPARCRPQILLSLNCRMRRFLAGWIDGLGKENSLAVVGLQKLLHVPDGLGAGRGDLDLLVVAADLHFGSQ